MFLLFIFNNLEGRENRDKEKEMVVEEINGRQLGKEREYLPFC